MAHVYASLIIKGRKTIDDVPENLKEEVIQILDEKGYNPDGSKKDDPVENSSEAGDE